MALTAEQILAASDIETEAVDVPEWGGKVFIHGLSAVEVDSYNRSLVVMDGKGNTKVGRLENVRASLVVRCLVDEDGERLFQDHQAKQLGAKSSAVIQRLWEIARRLSRMDDEQEEAEVEAFDAAQDGGNSIE
jgi:hypothetical protein